MNMNVDDVLRNVKARQAVKASGNSEGAKKGWEHRGDVQTVLDTMSDSEVSGVADQLSAKANDKVSHYHAAQMHGMASARHAKKGNKSLEEYHDKKMSFHVDRMISK